jgi:hypothetical protein
VQVCLVLRPLCLEEDGSVIADVMTGVGNNGAVMWLQNEVL